MDGKVKERIRIWFNFLSTSSAGEKSVYILSLTLMVLMVISVLVFSITSYRHRFSSDAATAAMIALEQIKNGSLFVKGWRYSQDFWPMFVFNGVVLLQPVLHNAFLSTQIPVMIQSFFIFLLTLFLVKRLTRNSLIYVLIAFIFSGVSYWWSEFYFGQGQYGNVLFWILLGILFIIKFTDSKIKNKSIIYGFGLFIINFYINTTSVRYIPVFSGIVLLTLFILYFVNRDSSTRKSCIIICTIIFTSTIMGLITFSWLKAHYIFNSGVAGSTLVGYDFVINENLAKLMHGFLALICDPAVGRKFSSLHGIFFAYRLCLSLIVFSLPVLVIVDYKKFMQGDASFTEIFLFIFTVLLTFITIFSLLFTALPVNFIAAARYMMLPVYFNLLLLPLLFKKFFHSWKIQLFVIILLIPLILFNSYSINDQILNTKSEKENLAEFLFKNDLTIGYATYWNADSVTVLSNYKVKIYHINNQMTPLLFMSAPDNYLPTGAKYNFLLLTKSESDNFDFGSIRECIGLPIKILDYSNYKIYVYDKEFARYLPGWKITKIK